MWRSSLPLSGHPTALRRCNWRPRCWGPDPNGACSNVILIVRGVSPLVWPMAIQISPYKDQILNCKYARSLFDNIQYISNILKWLIRANCSVRCYQRFLYKGLYFFVRRWKCWQNAHNTEVLLWWRWPSWLIDTVSHIIQQPIRRSILLLKPQLLLW